MKQPNILFFECDSMDGRLLGSLGEPVMRGLTPTLDRLAEIGTTYANTYCNNPVCCCSRASMWSGQYTFNCHGWNNYKGIPRNQRTFKTELEAAGYETAIFGKTDYVSGEHTSRARVSAWTRSAALPYPNFNMGLPIIFENQEQRIQTEDWESVDRSVEWLGEHAKDENPWFLYVGVNAPHPRYMTSRYYLDQVDESLVTMPGEEDYDHPALRYMEICKGWRHGFDEELVRKIRRIYYAMIAECDAMFKTVFDALEAQGVLEDTVVFFLSDHGDMNMEHRQYYKFNGLEPSARVPLLMAGPGIDAGRRVDDLVSLVDIFPTLMEIGGKVSTLKQDGQSLMPLARGEKLDRPNVAFCEYHDSTMCTGSFMYRRDNWKYLVFVGMEPLLFDLDQDPGELHNLAPLCPEKVAELDAELKNLVDYEAFDRLVKENDRDCFRVWRQEKKFQGTYEQEMSDIFSGYVDVTDEIRVPWTDELEAMILDWLETPAGEEKYDIPERREGFPILY